MLAEVLRRCSRCLEVKIWLLAISPLFMYGVGMNEADEKQRFDKLKRIEAQRKLRLDNFVSEAMKLREGREFFYWLLELGRIGRNPFTANALTTSFNCGEQNVGLQIQAHIIATAPKDYLKMLTEKEEENLYAQRPDAEPDNDA